MLSAEKKRIGEEFAASLGDERRLTATAHYIPALLAALDEAESDRNVQEGSFTAKLQAEVARLQQERDEAVKYARGLREIVRRYPEYPDAAYLDTKVTDFLHRLDVQGEARTP